MNKPGVLIKTVVILLHALMGWGYCGALVGIGRQHFAMPTTLVIHAIGAPIGFALISWLYFRKFSYTPPLQTAFIFLAVVMGLDAFIVAPVMEKSYAMFASLLGTWIPFALIFASTYFTGLLVTRKSAPTA
jgi:hypothetical protein